MLNNGGKYFHMIRFRQMIVYFAFFWVFPFDVWLLFLLELKGTVWDLYLSPLYKFNIWMPAEGNLHFLYTLLHLYDIIYHQNVPPFQIILIRSTQICRSIWLVRFLTQTQIWTKNQKFPKKMCVSYEANRETNMIQT